MPKTVLLAADHDDNRAALLLMLRRDGYTALGARNGRQAVDMALAEQPDLVILDLAMPVMDGREAARLLKADERTRHIPIVMLTAMALSVDRQHVAEEGFAGLLIKPCLPSDFIAEVRRHIGEPGPADAQVLGEISRR